MGDKGEGEVKNLKKGDVVYRPMIANCFRICHMQNKDRFFLFGATLVFPNECLDRTFIRGKLM